MVEHALAQSSLPKRARRLGARALLNDGVVISQSPLIHREGRFVRDLNFFGPHRVAVSAIAIAGVCLGVHHQVVATPFQSRVPVVSHEQATSHFDTELLLLIGFFVCMRLVLDVTAKREEGSFEVFTTSYLVWR